jgi:NitT/TauT family transport system substrate-binding protein
MRAGYALRGLLGLILVLGVGCGGPAGAPTSAPTPAAPTSAAQAASTAGARPAPTAAQGTATPGTAAQATGAQPTSGQLIPIKAAYPQATSVQGAAFVAKEQGFFARHGLDVELSRVGGPAQAAALLAGELQFGHMGANEVASAVLNGGPLVMLVTCSDLPVFSLYADKKYTSIQELSGQSIGITQAGSSTDATARLFLKQFDMTDKVHILPSGGTQQGILATLQAGVVAGGIVSPPTSARAEEAGFKELVNGVKLGVPLNQSGVVVNRNYLKDHPDQVKAFLTAYLEGWSFVADPANKPAVVSVLAKYTESDERLAALAYEAMVPIWSTVKVPRVTRDAVVNLLEVSGVPNAQAANPEQFFDNALIDSLAG